MLNEINVNEMQTVNGGMRPFGYTTRENNRSCLYAPNSGSIGKTCVETQGTGKVSYTGPKSVAVADPLKDLGTVNFEKQPYVRNHTQENMSESRATYEMWRSSERNSQR